MIGLKKRLSSVDGVTAATFQTIYIYIKTKSRYLDLDVSFLSVAVAQSHWRAVHWFLHQRE